MRKIKPPPSGSGGKRKAYYLEEAMQFCLPYIKTSAPPSSGNLPSVPLYSTGDDEGVGSAETPQDSDSQLDISVLVPPQTSQTIPSNTSVLPVSQGCTSEPFQDTSIPRTQFSSQRKTNLASRNRSAAEADRSVAEYFKAKKAKIQAIETTSSKTIDRQESLKMYLLSLLPELEELNDAQIKLFKRRVFSLIDEISTSSQHQPEISTFHTLLSPQSDSSHLSQTSTHSHATEFYHNFSQNL